MRIPFPPGWRQGRAVKPLDAAILRLPHISNFTDFMPLEQHPLLGGALCAETPASWARRMW